MTCTSFSTCISSSATARTISNITQYSASSISIGYQHIDEREEDEWEGDKTGLIDFTYQLGCLMERDTSIEAFGFARNVIVSTRRHTIVKILGVIVLQVIVTPSFFSLDMFAIFIPFHL